MKKGTYGYINHAKKISIIASILLFISIIAIFIIGLKLNDNSKANIFSIISALLSLPFAKIMVRAIIIFPFKTDNIEKYNRIKKLNIDGILLSDLMISSQEKVFHIPFLIICNNNVLIYLNNHKSIDLVSDYVKTLLTKSGYNHKIHIYKDFEELINYCNNETKKEFNINDEDVEVEKILLSLLV